MQAVSRRGPPVADLRNLAQTTVRHARPVRLRNAAIAAKAWSPCLNIPGKK
jgi:hypothetical protein